MCALSEKNTWAHHQAGNEARIHTQDTSTSWRKNHQTGPLTLTHSRLRLPICEVGIVPSSPPTSFLCGMSWWCSVLQGWVSTEVRATIKSTASQCPAPSPSPPAISAWP